MASQQRPPNREAFEIAILGASKLETSALESLFDEDWEKERPYGKASGDPNAYRLGSIANCNVVLAYIPGMGKIAAANAASWLQVSFPKISLALLVGICGGVPSSGEGNDILLGDVVISTGIVQYDFGRRNPDDFSQKDEREGNNLGRPVRQIRSFLEKLQAGEGRKTLRDNAYKFLVDIAKVEDIAFPGATEDKLYAPSYRHKHQRVQDCETCANCTSDKGAVCRVARKASCSALGCSSEQLIRRERIEDAETVANAKSEEAELLKPEIHFGKIASADLVMKSGLDRNAIALKEDVIAFEMEGAAIWENFPTIVVKSVCDYADSHKNNTWQKYAAHVAAACSRAVITAWREFNEEGASNDSDNSLQLWPPFQPVVGGLDEFEIPPDVLRSALATKERGKPSFWSHDMYRNSAGAEIKVDYSTNLASSERLASMFVDEPILGFSMQWLVPGESYIPSGEEATGLGEKYNISLIALAKESRICIFHLASHHGRSTAQKIAPTLKTILESQQRLKAGVCIFKLKSDLLAWRFGIQLRGIFELGDLHNLVDPKRNSIPEPNEGWPHIPINDLVEDHLRLDLYRGKTMRLSNWGRPELHPAQKAYVATDAYAGYQLFRVMDAKRLRLRPLPVPSLPVPAEQRPRKQRRRGQHSQHSPASNPPSAHSSASWTTMGEIAEEKTPTKKRRTNLQPAVQGPAQELSEDEEALFTALKATRLELAREHQIPELHLHRIIHDRVLRTLARKRPGDRDSFGKVNGIGKHTLENYGSKFVETIANHRRRV